MTSLANDYGFDTVFSRQIEALGQQGDAALAISTSGTSPNILKGIEAAQKKGMRIIGLTGKSGGSMAALCDSTIIVPSQETPRIQEAHELIYHIVCELVEQGVCNRL
ncbi:Phosphoheptose isomerase [subsurface metagenome]